MVFFQEQQTGLDSCWGATIYLLCTGVYSLLILSFPKSLLDCKESVPPLMFLSSFAGMLRASRNIWPRGPYPNKMYPLRPAKLPLPTRPPPPSPPGHSTSAPASIQILPACPEYFAPCCFPVSPCPPSCPPHWLQCGAAAQEKVTLFRLLLWFSPGAEDGCALPASWEKRKLIVCCHGFCPQLHVQWLALLCYCFF